MLFAPPDEVEPQALKQLRDIAESGYIEGHVAAMPDVHLGKGVTIGSVFASAEWVAPNAVGVDIGCGMGAVRIHGLYRDVGLPSLRKMQELIKERIPVGFNHHRHALEGSERVIKETMLDMKCSSWLRSAVRNSDVVEKQVGTLGGGNHFLELVYDELDRVWIFLHSGSRRIGNTTASHHNEVARDYMIRHGLPRPNSDLNFLHIDSREGQEYLNDMEWCQAYAFANRAAMIRVMKDVVAEVTGCKSDDSSEINIHHNYCSCEECEITRADGTTENKQLWVTRKGATSAKKGQIGLIPGSMGSGSYVVRGKGNPTSLQSCSHGAGRRMSRTAAFNTLSQAEFEQTMQGVVCDVDERLRDEAPAAYKDLSRVMQHQESLVEVVHHFHPLLNVKGIETPKQMRRSHRLKKR